MRNSKSVSQPKPVRPYRRFMPSKMSNTGHDPVKTFAHFIGRDPIEDMHRTRRTITLKEDFASVPRGKVPHGTTKCTYNIGLDTDGKLERNNIGYRTMTFPRSPTDHISSQPPDTERPFQNLFDRMIHQSKYEKNTKTTNPWSPKAPAVRTNNNLNSVSHNIITFEENKHAAVIPFTERMNQKHERVKGIAEINDLSRSTAINRNVDHRHAMSGNEGVFARKDGIFTHLYNSAARFGEN